MPPADSTKEVLIRMIERMDDLGKKIQEDREARAAESSRPVEVSRLRLPLLVWLVSIPTLLTAGATGLGLYNKITEHIADNVVHLDRQAAIRGDGPAYAATLDQKIQAVRAEEAAREKRIAATLKASKCLTWNGKSCRLQFDPISVEGVEK